MKLPFYFLIFHLFFLYGCDKKSATEPEDHSVPILTPQEAIGQMIRGINIGNTLEPPSEGEWNNGPLQEYYFDDYTSAGFTCVRIPVKWGSHTGGIPPYTIHPSWLDRVEQIVDWGLERDLFIIINGHHEDWLKQDYTPANQARYDSIWSQVSERFKNKSQKLLFEMINEPIGLTLEQINDLNVRILSIIRETNPTRIVIYSGRGYSALDNMIEAAVPVDDYLIAYFHSYDPWSFAGEGNGTWGTEADRNAIKSMFDQAANWSSAHNIPVMIGEFGAVHACDYNSRMRHYHTYVEQALEHNIAFQVWDDGGYFGIYDREYRSWPEVKDILIYTYPEGPTSLQTTVEGDSTVILTWENRTDSNQEIIIERGVASPHFSEFTRLDADAAEFRDSNVVRNGVYFYRIIADFDESSDLYSYPVKVTVQTRSSY